MQNSREIVRRTLTFQKPERLPVNLWILPWARMRYAAELQRLEADFPGDLAGAPPPTGAGRASGDPYAVGTSTDDWGCEFENLQAGVIGEVKNPMVKTPADWRCVKPPREQIPTGAARTRAIAEINAFCRSTDKFVLSGCCPRPWERYQFLRGSENALMDVLLRDPGVDELLEQIHAYYREEMEFWAETEVDALSFMDDWGTQRALQIPPPVWRELFKPMYRDYCRIAREHGKFAFMHSDGCIQEIYPDLIEIGVNAVNSQLACMDLDRLAEFKEKIAFWGEIDRQHVMCAPDPETARREVRRIAEKLYSPAGGIFCQFEIGPGARLENARAVCEEWARIAGIR